MKKHLSAIVVALTCCTLIACSSQNTPEQPQEQGSSSAQVTENLASSDKQWSDDNYSPLIEQLKELYPTSQYTLVDIDKNGVSELIVGRIEQVEAIYYLKLGQPTLIAAHRADSSSDLQQNVVVYQDGKIFSSEWSSTDGKGIARTYQLKKDNSGLNTLIEKQNYNANRDSLAEFLITTAPLNLAKADWKKLGTSTYLPLNVTEIQSGNYQTIAGTWKNNLGDTLTIREDGSIEQHSSLHLGPNSIIQNGILEYSLSSSQQSLNRTLLVIPAMIEYSPDGSSDTSDIQKDRLLFGQDLRSDNPLIFYYRS